MDEVLKKLLESVDSKVLTESVKTQITEAFDNAVKAEAEKLNDTLIESVETNVKAIIESKIHDLKENYDNAVKAKASELSKEQDQKLVETVEKYVDVAIEKFVEDNKADWNDEVKSYKADKIVESMAKLAGHFGVEIQKIELEDADAKVLLDESIDKNKSLKEENFDLKKELIMKESIEGLTVAKAEKLEKLAESIEVDDIDKFKEQVELYKVTLVEGSSDKEDKKKKKKEESSKKVDDTFYS